MMVSSAAFLLGVLAATTRALDLRLISHNVRQETDDLQDGEKPWVERLPYMSAQLHHEVAGNPDTLMCFQEAKHDQVEDLKSAMGNGWEYFGVGREGGQNGEYSPIFYRSTAFDLVDSHTYWLSENPDEEGSTGWDAAYPRIATVAKLQHKATSKNLVYICTHFDHKGTVAVQKSAELILQFADEWSQDGAYVFVGGDLNLDPSKEAYKTLIGGLTDTIDAVPDNRHYGYDGTFSGWNSDAEGDRIDYIFTQEAEGLKFVDYAVLHNVYDGVYSSDHRPVVADGIIS